MSDLECDFKSLAQNIGVVNRFTERGDVPESYIRVEEAEVLLSEHRSAIISVCSALFPVFYDPKIACLIMAKADNWNGRRYVHIASDSNNNSAGINLVKVTPEKNQLELEYSRHQSLPDPKDQRKNEPSPDERFQQDVRSRFPSSLEEWNFLRQNNQLYMRKNLEPIDLAQASGLFTEFIKGSNKVFEEAVHRVESFTLSKMEAERIKRLTIACNGATQIILDAFDSPAK